MDIKQLRAFYAVVEKGSFSQAADMLSLAQPTISFQIASLEKELGTKLLDRGGRGITVSKSGKIFYQYASRILKLTEEARQAIDQVQGQVRGELVIAASTVPGEYFLPSLLSEFKRNYPGIDISLVITDTKDVIRRVIDNEMEVGAVGASDKNRKLTFIKFAMDKLVLIATPHNSWFKQDVITLDELKSVPFISRESGSGTRLTMKRGLENAGLSEAELNIVMELGSTAAVKKAVECGSGVSIISDRVAENEIKSGVLKEVRVEGLQLNRDLFLVHKRQKTLSATASAFLQFIQAQKKD